VGTYRNQVDLGEEPVMTELINGGVKAKGEGETVPSDPS
jgi:hypothetical protein